MPDKISGEIRISFYGNLIRYRLKRGECFRSLPITENGKLRDVATEFGINVKDINFAHCNGEKVTLDFHLSPGDEIKLYSLMSGG